MNNYADVAEFTLQTFFYDVALTVYRFDRFARRNIKVQFDETLVSCSPGPKIMVIGIHLIQDFFDPYNFVRRSAVSRSGEKAFLSNSHDSKMISNATPKAMIGSRICRSVIQISVSPTATPAEVYTSVLR